MYALRAIFVASLCAVASIASASSHREAPAIAEDQYADNTDVYAFISPEDPSRVVLIANYVPLLSPASGPNFYRFSDHVLYEIRIDNDGDAVPDLSYEFRFTTATRTGDTFLYNTGGVTSITDTTLNVHQSYSITRRDLATGTSSELGANIPVAPWDVGRRSFPDYNAVAAGATQMAGTARVFAGPRRETFQVDFNVFDLLGLGPRAMTATMGGATYPGGNLRPNFASGYNVMSLVVSVPITDVADGGVRPATGTERNSLIGVYATASRRQTTILRRTGGSAVADRHGQWVQVSRLGLPLVNEVLIPLRNKDNYNRTNPVDDATNYGATILNPELNGLLIGVIPELACTPTPGTGNATLLAVLTPNGTDPGDLLRLNIATGQAFAQSGFPNGRTLTDDALTAEVNIICSGSPGTPLPADVIGGPEVPGITATFPYLPPPIRAD